MLKLHKCSNTSHDICVQYNMVIWVVKFPNIQLGINLENKVFRKLKLSKYVFYKMHDAKRQFFSKGLLGILGFSQKTNEQIRF